MMVSLPYNRHCGGIGGLIVERLRGLVTLRTIVKVELRNR